MTLPTTVTPYNHALDPSWRLMAEFRPTDLMNWAKQYLSGDNDSFNGTLEQYKPTNGNIASEASFTAATSQFYS